MNWIINDSSENGTIENLLKINGHNLNKGDWIRNNSRKWVVREVLEVLDRNTIRVEKILNQTLGDLIERYHNSGKIIAEK